MKVPSFFKSPKYKQFEYAPRYYDPIKEQIEQRTKSLEQMRAGEHTEEQVEMIRQRISSTFRRTQREKKRSFMIQLLIVMMLSLLAWLYLV